MIRWLRKKLNINMSNWIEKRLPVQPSVTLDQSKIFIVPTRQGLMLLLISLLVILLAINFESALNYALAFWIVSILWVAVHLTFRNLSGLSLIGISGNLVRVGDTAEVTIKLTSRKPIDRGVVEFIHEEWGSVQAHVSGLETWVRLPLTAYNRGPVSPPRFRLESRFPFGLVVAWSQVHLDVRAWAYPISQQFERVAVGSDVDDDQDLLDDHFFREGSEDFHSLRAYVPGDSIKRMHWPGFARDVLLVKAFSDYQSSDEIIAWDQFPGVSDEQRLAAIAYYSEVFHRRQLPFGVVLPGYEIEPGKGSEHLNKVRRILAEFGYV
ncbi:DUF58 domain-containing protein [Reinekea sp. G2M2-21]|uniref:DUF58 domain-containing protein n=1 Tax=Reinekea sp. G2M2-21 TaxID=2788942 RepID=UPI0018A8C749